jgi:hypothetical protein
VLPVEVSQRPQVRILVDKLFVGHCLHGGCLRVARRLLPFVLLACSGCIHRVPKPFVPCSCLGGGFGRLGQHHRPVGVRRHRPRARILLPIRLQYVRLEPGFRHRVPVEPGIVVEETELLCNGAPTELVGGPLLLLFQPWLDRDKSERAQLPVPVLIVTDVPLSSCTVPEPLVLICAVPQRMLGRELASLPRLVLARLFITVLVLPLPLVRSVERRVVVPETVDLDQLGDELNSEGVVDKSGLWMTE